jgi:O-6-methylguanine DNA methyltransferase
MNNEEWEGLVEMRRLMQELAELGGAQAPEMLLPTVLGRVGLADRYFGVESPLGPAFVAYNDHGLSALLLGDEAAGFEEAFQARFGRRVQRSAEPPAALARAIAAHLAERRPAGLRFDLRGRTPFEQAVLAKALEIPRGEVRPYAWIASEIGHPRAVRAVGTALGRNPIPLLIPCHRVVRSDGHIGHYAFGREAKVALLQAEGVEPGALERLAEAGVRYCGSDTTRIYCYPTCRHAQRIAPAHRVAFRSATQAADAGYRPCRDCRPASEAG